MSVFQAIAIYTPTIGCCQRERNF